MNYRQPAVGRPVHYVIPAGERGDAVNECRAAIITAVKDPAGYPGGGIVDLRVLDPAGPHSEQDVSHVHAEHLVGDTWHWPQRADVGECEMPEAAAEAKVADLARVTLNPGDRLVLRVTDNYTPYQMRDLGEYLEAQIPGHQVIVVPGDLGVLAEQPEPEYRGRAIITRPSPNSSRALSNWGVTIHDADTGEPILTGFKVSIVLGTDTAYEDNVIEADITALIDENGNILPSGKQPIPTVEYRAHQDRIKAERLDGPLTDEEADRLDALDREFTGQMFRTDVFRFVVAEMRVAGESAAESDGDGRLMADTITVYVSIGNSDDKLTQVRWSDFQSAYRRLLGKWSTRSHGVWMSEPSSAWQNACICLEINEGDAPRIKAELALLAAEYGQDSIAWAVAETEFLSPDPAEAPAAADPSDAENAHPAQSPCYCDASSGRANCPMDHTAD